MYSWFLVLVLLAVDVGASVLSPPVLPLVVRNPYLSTWLPNRDLPWDKWPMFWNGQEVSWQTHRRTSVWFFSCH